MYHKVEVFSTKIQIYAETSFLKHLLHTKDDALANARVTVLVKDQCGKDVYSQ